MKEIKFTIPLAPVTKKNSQQIKYKWAKDKTTGKPKRVPYIAPSEAYLRYENDAGWYINRGLRNLMISAPVNLRCLFYMPTNGRVDLPNLLNATDDLLVKYRVLADDNCDIVCTHDGSRVIKGDKHPRTEITISFYDVFSQPKCCDSKTK